MVSEIRALDGSFAQLFFLYWGGGGLQLFQLCLVFFLVFIHDMMLGGPSTDYSAFKC